MKGVFYLLSFFSLNVTSAKNYYFSSSTGDDSLSPIQASNPMTPWKTLNKLNAFFNNINPGDSILFERGEIFNGSINVTKSGTSGAPIVFSCYGEGEKPVINGFSTLSMWVKVDNGIWECSIPGTPATINMLTVNGKVQGIGRYPNLNEPNKGYLTVQSHVGITSITDKSLTTSPSWTGAEVVIRKNRWVIDRNIITKHTGNTIGYISASHYEPFDGYGYFIQNHPGTLDQNGEWFFDAKEKKMRIYFGAASPQNVDIKASTVETLVSIKNQSNIHFDNLVFTGSNVNAFLINKTKNITIKNCSILFSGTNGITGYDVDFLQFKNSLIANTNNDALYFPINCSNSLFSNNIINNTGLFAGMGKSANDSYQAIIVRGTNNLIKYNEVDSTGYTAIRFEGDYIVVKNNFVHYFTLIKDDGGGIVTWGDSSKYGRKIINNIVLNGVGAPEGTNNINYKAAEGIYIDDKSANVDIISNTVANTNSGIYIHNARNINITDNHLFNNQSQITFTHDHFAQGNPIRNLTVKNNVFFSKKRFQSTSNISTIRNDIAQFGNFNNNYYCRPLAQDFSISSSYIKEGKKLLFNQNLSDWKRSFNLDSLSTHAPVSIPEYTLENITGTNKYNNGSFNNNISGLHSWSANGNCRTSYVNDGEMDGGALKVSYTSVSATENRTFIIIGAGAISSNKKYLLRFSLKGSKNNQYISVFLRKSLAPYTNLTEIQHVKLLTTRTENEVLFTAPIAEVNASIVIEMYEEDSTLWLDNIQLHKAAASVTNPEHFIRFEYNATNVNKTFFLDVPYLDSKNRIYTGLITLAPYESLILMKKTITNLPEASNELQYIKAENERNLFKEQNVRVYPNPFVDNIKIELNNMPKGTYIINLISNSGQSLMTETVSHTNPTSIEALNINPNLTKGIYYLQITGSGNKATYLLLKI